MVSPLGGEYSLLCAQIDLTFPPALRRSTPSAIQRHPWEAKSDRRKLSDRSRKTTESRHKQGRVDSVNNTWLRDIDADRVFFVESGAKHLPTTFVRRQAILGIG
jgi:hypothetical protein